MGNGKMLARARGMGIKTEELVKHRIYNFGTTGGGTTLAGTTDVYISLLSCLDDPTWDNATDGTNIAHTRTGAKITSIDLFLVWKVDANKMHELMLFRDRDGSLGAQVPSTALATGDYTPTIAELRANMLSYMPIYRSNASDTKAMKITVNGAALRRAGKMHENDIIKLFLRNNGSGTSIWWLFGSINTVS